MNNAMSTQSHGTILYQNEFLAPSTQLKLQEEYKHVTGNKRTAVFKSVIKLIVLQSNQHLYSQLIIELEARNIHLDVSVGTCIYFATHPAPCKQVPAHQESSNSPA